MKITIETEWLLIVVQIYDGTRARFSYAVMLMRLSGDTIRLTIPELCTALERAARKQKARA